MFAAGIKSTIATVSSRDPKKKGSTYVDRHSIIAIKLDDGLTTRLIFDPVLRSEPGHDLDAVGTRHFGAMNARCDKVIVSSTQAAGRELVRCGLFSSLGADGGREVGQYCGR